MLLAGANAKVVSERLGHSSVGFTLQRYTHVLPGMQADAAAALSRALFG
jgi:integrase